jgi:Calcineurin-like phosphoesterase
MRTLVISDLHLGTRSGADVLTRPAALAALLERLDGVDRLVLLGDTLELRHGPARDALAVAEPIMRAIGGALGAGGQVVLVPGNHDHAIGAGWLDWRERREPPAALGLDERVAASRASWIAKRLATWLGPAEVEVAYPGLWLRDDVYATHGHYLDAHFAIPTLERLSVGALARMVGGVPDPAAAEDYEAVLAPLYALSHSSAQRAGGRRSPVGGRSAVGIWKALSGTGRARPLRGWALALPFRLGILAINRAGLGPVQADISVAELRRCGLAAIGETARRLRIAPPHLVFGHTHRAGPLGGDDPHEWRTPAATQLHNSGSWVFDTLFVGRGEPGASPYWPGSAIALADGGPPRLERLLTDVPLRVLRPGRP